MPKGSLDDLLPSPDEIMFMGEDLSALRELTGQSEAALAHSAPAMMWWGCVIAMTSLGFILRYIDVLPPWVPVSSLELIFGVGGSLAIWYRSARTTTFTTWQLRAVRIIWIFGCSGIFLFNVGCGLTHINNIPLSNSFLCFMFGVTTAALGALRRREWLLIPAIGWMAAGFASLFLNDVISRQTVLGLASACFMAVPGFVMIVGKRIP